MMTGESRRMVVGFYYYIERRKAAVKENIWGHVERG